MIEKIKKIEKDLIELKKLVNKEFKIGDEVNCQNNALNEIREYINRVANKGYNFGWVLDSGEIDYVLQIINKVLGDD